MTADGYKEQVEQERRRRSRFFFILHGEVLFSDAFRSVAGHGPSVTALLMIIARQPLPPPAKERRRLEKAGMWPPKPAPFSFPIREAQPHGLTPKGLSQGLQRLHAVGFIDRIHSGSATKGDFSVYSMSERWKRWGTSDFVELPWPKAQVICSRAGDGKFVQQRMKKLTRGKLLVAEIATTKRRPMAKIATTAHPIVAEIAMNEADCTPPVVAESAVFLSLPGSSDGDRKVHKNDFACGRREIPSKTSEERWLSGWKSIASHFGVSRSTAITWSDRRGMPVVRNGGIISAEIGSLDAWRYGCGRPADRKLVEGWT